MDEKTKGAWIIHHGRKISGIVGGAAQYPAIDIAAKSGALLARMAVSEGSVLNAGYVKSLAKIGGLSPKTDLPACLNLLVERKVIDISTDGSVSIIGITASSALDYTSAFFKVSDPAPFELAAIGLSELVSQSPVEKKLAGEKIGDDCRLSTEQVADFLEQATDLGFIESDGDGDDPLLFNGNLFRRDSVAKTKKVLDSFSSAEQTAFSEFEAALKSSGALNIVKADQILGTQLLSKLRAAAVFDENIVSNEAGEHSFITSPGAFNKFIDPMVDDAFDHAKSLVAALSYGMHVSSKSRGNILSVNLLLKKMLDGNLVGPAPAIGMDYRALEFERVISIIPSGSSYQMKLLKHEVGEIALHVLKHGNADAAIVRDIREAQVSGYTGPEKARTIFRKREDLQPSKTQIRGMLDSVRSEGGI